MHDKYFNTFVIKLENTILAVKEAGHLNIKTKMPSEYSQRVFASQKIRTRASKLVLC